MPFIHRYHVCTLKLYRHFIYWRWKTNWCTATIREKRIVLSCRLFENSWFSIINIAYWIKSEADGTSFWCNISHNIHYSRWVDQLPLNLFWLAIDTEHILLFITYLLECNAYRLYASNKQPMPMLHYSTASVDGLIRPLDVEADKK